MHRNVFRALTMTAALGLIVLPVGCVALVDLFNNDGGGGSGGVAPNDNDNISEPNGDVGQAPNVRLSISDDVPRVGDEVILTCSVVGGSSAGVTFSFSPANWLEEIDQTSGRAIFLVDSIDVNNDFEFTCSGTNEFGTGPASNRVSFIPTE